VEAYMAANTSPKLQSKNAARNPPDGGEVSTIP
jgi:hypothetical protein